MIKDEAFADVETTNWNAVKLLATQYGIQLRPLEEIKASKSNFANNSVNDEEGDYESQQPDELEDLGVGTPFKITAQRIDGGKVVYRFVFREKDGKAELEEREGGEEDNHEAPLSEKGYVPGSDSPSSSWGKKAGQRKQPSTRTLKTKRSIPLLQLMSSIGQEISGGSSSRSPNDYNGVFSSKTNSLRETAPKIQGGDVLGAILGLREGIMAQDYSWIDGSSNEGIREKQKSPKSKGKGRQSDTSNASTTSRQSKRSSEWQIIKCFGEPVLKRRRAASIGTDSSADRVLSRLWPNASDEGDDIFHDASLPAEDGEEPMDRERYEYHDKDDYDDEAIIFDVLQHYNIKGGEAHEEDDMNPSSSPFLVHPRRARQTSSSSELPCSPSTTDDRFNDASSIKVTPGDDPRFALWAIRSRSKNDTLILSSRDGTIDYIPSSPISTLDASTSTTPGTPSSAKRFSLRSPNSANSSTDVIPSPGNLSSSQRSLILPPNNKQQAILLAASTSCLIAELTSRIDSQLLTDFFYTYRAYMSSQELLHLLILRLRWAMAVAREPKDEIRRKIVRVRTYVVIKYWLTNFFEIDFVPDRALRSQLTDWLNSPVSDEAASIIKSLRKLVRGLKKSFEQGGVGAILFSDATDTLESNNREHKESEVEGSDGIKSTSISDNISRHDDSSSTKSVFGTESWKSVPLSSHHAAPPPLPITQSAISRAFVNTVGKLSRIKRNLNTRSTTSPHFNTTYYSGTSDVEGLEAGGGDGGDLLFIRGGVESFLKFFNMNPTVEEIVPNEEDQASDSTTAQEQTPSLSTTSHQTSSTPASSIDFGSRERGNGERGISASRGVDIEGRLSAQYGLGISHEESDGELGHLTHANLAKKASAELLHHFQSDQTLRSLSTAQPPALFAPESPRSKSSQKQKNRLHHRQFSKSSSLTSSSAAASSSARGPDNIVQIDDIDSSSDEDDAMVRKALRRLPGARDLRMANHVRDLETAPRASLDSLSVTSFGRVYSPSHRNVSSYYGKDATNAVESTRSSLDDMPWPSILGAPIQLQKITTVQTEMFDPDEALVGYELVKGFQLDQLDSDDEEPGDVEAALRRLEGFIDQDKQKEKQRKVEAMWLRSRAQRDENEDKEEARTKEEERESSRQSTSSAAYKSRSDQDSVHDQAISARKEKTQTAMPITKSSTMKVNPASVQSTTTSPITRLNTPSAPKHKSFLLNHRSEVIAQQFCLIESELFKAITWQELVSEEWKSKHFTRQVLNWESFYQATVRRKAEESGNEYQSSNQVSNVEALVARFNLTCNWVASEVVLTRHVDDRAAVICKLIRIAWKCYHHCNFATLTQIILGLQSPWVERLSKTWSRIGMLEMRMLRDLKAFINPARNFKHLRTAMHDMIIQGGMMELITSNGPPKSGFKTTNQNNHLLRLSDGCIPFFGLFLSDLTVNDALPSFIEPSSPDSTLMHHKASSLVEPTTFSHLPPLPEQIQVKPLVNLYKYRNIAIIVKSILAFQHRLNSFEYEADANVYVKALRIRCLEGEQLTQISQLVEP